MRMIIIFCAGLAAFLFFSGSGGSESAATNPQPGRYVIVEPGVGPFGSDGEMASICVGPDDLSEWPKTLVVAFKKSRPNCFLDSFTANGSKFWARGECPNPAMRPNVMKWALEGTSRGDGFDAEFSAWLTLDGFGDVEKNGRSGAIAAKYKGACG